MRQGLLTTIPAGLQYCIQLYTGAVVVSVEILLGVQLYTGLVGTVKKSQLPYQAAAHAKRHPHVCTASVQGLGSHLEHH